MTWLALVSCCYRKVTLQVLVIGDLNRLCCTDVAGAVSCWWLVSLMLAANAAAAIWRTMSLLSAYTLLIYAAAVWYGRYKCCTCVCECYASSFFWLCTVARWLSYIYQQAWSHMRLLMFTLAQCPDVSICLFSVLWCKYKLQCFDFQFVLPSLSLVSMCVVRLLT